MPAISSGDAAVIRKQARIKGVYVNIASLTPVATATVATTPDWSNPVSVIAVTGESGGWDVGGNAISAQYVRITRGSAVIYEGVQRLTATTGELRLAAMREGDTGRAQEIAKSIQSGDSITLYSARMPHSFVSRIGSGGEFYKRYDVPYNTSGTYTRRTEYPQPLGKTGTQHKHVRVPVGGTASVDYTAADTKLWNGFSASYTWSTNPNTGVTIAPSSTDTAVTITAPVGEYVVLLQTLEATTALTDGQRRYLWVTDGDTAKAFSDDFPLVAIENDTQDRIGRSATFVFETNDAAAIAARLYIGAPFLLSVEHEYSGDRWQTQEAAPDGVVQDFFGYIERYETIAREPDGTIRVAVHVLSPVKYYERLPIPQQTLVAADPPTNWTEVAPTHQTLEHALYYIMEYHSAGATFLNDFDASALTSFRKFSLTIPAGSIGNGLQKTAALCLGASVGSVSDGRIFARRNPSLEGSTFRGALANVWTWQAGDIVGALEYERDPLYKVSELEIGGWVTGVSENPAAVIGRAGLYAPSQGISKQTGAAFIGLSSNDVLDRVGHEYQRLNAPTPQIRFEARGGIDVIDPALMEWHTLDVGTYDPLSTGVWSGRVLPLAVARQWDFSDAGDIRKRVIVTCEPETEGRRAPLKPAPTIGAPLKVPTNSWVYEFDFTVDDGGWAAAATTDAPWALYTAGVGWGTNDVKSPTSTTYHRIVSIRRTFSSATVTSMEVHYSYTQGAEAYNPSADDWGAFRNGTQNHVYTRSSAASTLAGLSQVRTFSFSGAATSLLAQFMTSWDNSAPYTYSGSATITKIIARGTGINPF